MAEYDAKKGLEQAAAAFQRQGDQKEACLEYFNALRFAEPGSAEFDTARQNWLETSRAVGRDLEPRETLVSGIEIDLRGLKNLDKLGAIIVGDRAVDEIYQQVEAVRGLGYPVFPNFDKDNVRACVVGTLVQAVVTGYRIKRAVDGIAIILPTGEEEPDRDYYLKADVGIAEGIPAKQEDFKEKGGVLEIVRDFERNIMYKAEEAMLLAKRHSKSTGEEVLGIKYVEREEDGVSVYETRAVPMSDIRELHRTYGLFLKISDGSPETSRTLDERSFDGDAGIKKGN